MNASAETIIGPQNAITSKFLKLSTGLWIGGIVLLAAAAMLRWWVAPFFELLPADYVSETRYGATMQSRQAPFTAAEEVEAIVRRRDQVMISDRQHVIVQGDAHRSTPAGVLIFENINVYGVDRHSRKNLADYGNEKRVGQYLFPPHTGKQQYDFSDPIHAGTYIVTFDHAENFHGTEVYLYNTVADGIDETVGYSSLPNVPKKYRAMTYGKGRYWVEPVSGVVVDHEDSGTSYFIDQASGQRVGEPINQWSARYTPETILAQLHLATVTRWQMLALERWLPIAFAAAGMISIAAGFGAVRGRTR
jgi:Porin PorA